MPAVAWERTKRVNVLCVDLNTVLFHKAAEAIHTGNQESPVKIGATCFGLHRSPLRPSPESVKLQVQLLLTYCTTAACAAVLN